MDSSSTVNYTSITVREPSDVSADIAFAPEMAHQVYGETENIFGYKDLSINVYYSAGPLDIYYDVKYSKKVSNNDPSPNLGSYILSIPGWWHSEQQRT